ncbi:MAG: YraN family protein [Oceanospirillaceae bacterium]|nr:YraN family protein [Oceanospirillaceae bacterium]
MDRRAKGKDAEQKAEHYLQSMGLKTLKRNAQCRLGEIDLIMRDGEHLVFIEVRQRSGSGFGGAAQSVDLRKQQKLIRTARFLLARNPGWSALPCRFDVIAYESDSAERPPIWYKDAFRP